VEPNDEPRQATSIALDTDVKGTIGATSPEGKNDRDFYLVRVPEGPVRVSLSGVTDLNLTLEMAQLTGGTHLSPLLFLDDTGVSGDERVDALWVHEGPLYLKVEEAAYFDEPPRSPREKALVPYTLRVEAMSGGPYEREPNDTLSTAQSCPLTKSFTAFTGAHGDPDRVAQMRPQFALSSVDYFKVEVSDEVVQVGVLVVPPPKCKLSVVDGVALETWQQKHSAATSPMAHAASNPKVVTVEGGPKVVRLSPAGGRRMARIQGGDDCPPGSEYRVAFITNEDNGLASAIDLSKQLAELGGHEDTRQKAAEEAANVFPGSPQAMELKSLVK
jgi:hypothetical protein